MRHVALPKCLCRDYFPHTRSAWTLVHIKKITKHHLYSLNLSWSPTKRQSALLSKLTFTSRCEKHPGAGSRKRPAEQHDANIIFEIQHPVQGDRFWMMVILSIDMVLPPLSHHRTQIITLHSDSLLATVAASVIAFDIIRCGGHLYL